MMEIAVVIGIVAIGLVAIPIGVIVGATITAALLVGLKLAIDEISERLRK